VTTAVRWEELVDRPDIDALLISSPSHTHAEIGIRALDSDKHVLIEKPIALTLHDADRLCYAEQAAGRVAGVGLHLRHLPLMRRLAKAMVQIGVPTGGHSAFHNHLRTRKTVSGYERTRTAGGGALYDLAYHHFDLYSWLFGAHVASVYCTISSRESDDDIVTTHTTLENGIAISGSFSSTTTNENLVTIFGQDGKVAADMYRSLRPEYRPVLEGNVRRILNNVFSAMPAAGMGLYSLQRVRLAPFIQQWISFRDAVRGLPNELPRTGDGRRALRVVLAAYASASSRREMSV